MPKKSPIGLIQFLFVFCFIWISFFISLSTSFAESLGDLKVEDLTLRPQAYIHEPQTGGFSLGESSVTLGWNFDQFFKAHFQIGAHSLLARPAFYPGTKDTQDLDLLEAYAEVEGMLGRFEFGLIPLELTSDGQTRDGDLIFSRSAIYSKGLLGLRDFGVRYSVNYNHFFTSVMIHNGEGASDKDNLAWYSATRGYDFHKLRLAFFGQTGSTKPMSTAGSTLTVADFNPAQNSKWRIGGFFAQWKPSSFEMSLEGAMGNKEQEQSDRKFTTGHLELGEIGKQGWGGFFRYNVFDPDMKVTNDAEHRISLAGVWANPLRTSKLILIGTKVFEEKNQIQNDEIQLVWSLTPVATE